MNGIVWKRVYSSDEKRYYWLKNGDRTAKDPNAASWNPWNLNNQTPPWVTIGGQEWAKFHNEGKPYYYHYKTQKSLYQRPKEYESDEILTDSATDDDY